MKQKVRKIQPHNKSGWRKLDELKEYKNTLTGKWKQQGPYIVNKSGKLDYGIYIGMDKKLVGIDEKGQPILESR